MILPKVTQLTVYYRIRASTSVHFGPSGALNSVPQNFMSTWDLEWDLFGNRVFTDIIKIEIKVRFKAGPKSNESFLISQKKKAQKGRGKEVI